MRKTDYARPGSIFLALAISFSLPAFAQAASAGSSSADFAILPLSPDSSVAEEDVELLSTLLRLKGSRIESHRLLSASDMASRLSVERLKKYSNCDSLSCAAAIASKLRTPIILTGQVSEASGAKEKLVIALSLFDLRAGKLRGQAKRTIAADENLFDETIQSLLNDCFDEKTKVLGMITKGSERKAVAQFEQIATTQIGVGTAPGMQRGTIKRSNNRGSPWPAAIALSGTALIGLSAWAWLSSRSAATRFEGSWLAEDSAVSRQRMGLAYTSAAIGVSLALLGGQSWLAQVSSDSVAEKIAFIPTDGGLAVTLGGTL